MKIKRPLSYGNIFAIVFVHAVTALFFWHFITRGAGLKSWILFAIFFLLTSFGVTVGYHRMLTHRGLQCGGVLRFLLSVGGGMAAQGPEYTWVANHRVHHFFADQQFDPHSPRAFPGIKGLLWAHVLWLFFKYERPPQYERFPDLDRDKMMQWQKRFYLPIVLAGFVIPFAVAGWEGLFLAGFLRLVITWHVSWSVNSICHLFGSEAKDTDGQTYSGDDSKNNLFVAIFSMGEGYHSNHHARPMWAYHGWEWYSLDGSKWLLQFLELFGIVWNVKKPSRIVRFREAALKNTA